MTMPRPNSPPRREVRLRLALRLENHLADSTHAAATDPMIAAASELIIRQDLLRTALARHQLVCARNWSAAALRTRNQVAFQLRELTYQLNCVNHNATPRRCPATAGQILADIRALDDEFDGLLIADDLSCLSVVTEGITLEGVDLGRFRIELDLHRLIRRYRDSSILCIVALDPNPAARDESVVHPHVQGTGICLGDGAAAVSAALSDGRLYDAIQIVNRVLHTYNDSSPYVSLDSWSGVRCDNCDEVVAEDELYTCHGCDNRLCSDCEHVCADCEEGYCRNCLNRDGDDMVCASCLESRESNRQEEEEPPEEPEPLEPAKETDHEPATQSP
jgi:hypothetical protein